MKKIDIQHDIESLKNRLVEVYAPEKIILFGSAAWGGDEVGDIDVFIIKKGVPHYGADRVAELYRLMESELPVVTSCTRPTRSRSGWPWEIPFSRRS